VVSGGDLANVPIGQLEDFLTRLFEIESIRDVRLASKSLIGLPQYFLQDDVLRAIERLSKAARMHHVELAFHTHVNHANSMTPIVAEAISRMLDIGIRDVRNQTVILRGVNDTTTDILDLCFTIRDHGRVMPYYLYMCDMIPNSEHWRISLAQAQELQNSIMGYLPGFATPRVICDPPLLGKKWVHQVDDYDRVRGISYWTKNYFTTIEAEKSGALGRKYMSYDPVHSLPEEGKEYWRQFAQDDVS
jgi:lysine 2,3-aminomutase